jgi:hypothetical protein
VADAARAYRPIVEHLPAIYQEDPDSYEQVTGFLALVDHLYRAYLAELEDLSAWLSPEARRVWPPGLALDADAETIVGDGTPAARGAVGTVFSELASWFAYSFPPSWSSNDAEADRDLEREFLLRVPRLWRRRGTPTGFYSWLCFYFALEEPERPFLIEHFKYRSTPLPGAAPTDDDDDAHLVTLLVPRTTKFDDYRRRRELLQFIAREAPAHLFVRLCWVAPTFTLDLTKKQDVRAVLDTLAGFVPLSDGLHLNDVPLATVLDRLGEGLLPGGGRTT